MMSGSYIAITLFASGFAALQALGQLVIPTRRISNWNLAFLFTVLSITFFHFSCVLRFYSGSGDAACLWFHLTTLYLAGVILYYAYYLVIFPESLEAVPVARHALFLLLPLSADIWLLLQGSARREQLWIEFLDSGVFGSSSVIAIAVAGGLFHFFLYLAVLLRKALGIVAQASHRTVVLVTIFFIGGTIGILMMLAAGYLFAMPEITTIAVLSFSLLLAVTYLVGQRYPTFLHLLRQEAERKRYEHSRLQGIYTDELLSRLDLLMKKDKRFSDESLTLSMLASEVELTPHQLSELLNEKLEVNFNSYVNQYRISEARTLLLEDPKRSVLSIAYAVGFNSKSSFYDAFSRFTGLTPKEYRKKRI